MARNQPRKSGLAGRRPGTPAAADPTKTAEVPPAQPAPEAASRAKPASAQTPLSKTKLGFYVDKGDADRARACFANLPVGVRPRSFSDFLTDAVMAKVVDLEHQHNNGEPWPVLEPGAIAPGRPVGG